MQLKEIEAFIAVCDSPSFRVAAKRLYLTQPAISKRLAALEARLGHRLFDRVGRGAVLTEAGRTYLPHARRLLLEVENSNRALDNLSDEVDGHLGLALSHHIALHRIPPVLREFVRTYPQVEVNIEFLDSEMACQAVARGQLELAVITLPHPPREGLEQREVWRDPLCIVVARNHPLALTKSPLNPTSLSDYPALLPEESTYTHRIVAQALAQFGVTPKSALHCNYLETLKMLTSVGLGWSALPTSLVDSSVYVLDFENLHLSRSLGTLTDPERSLSNAARALLAMLHEP